MSPWRSFGETLTKDIFEKPFKGDLNLPEQPHRNEILKQEQGDSFRTLFYHDYMVSSNDSSGEVASILSIITPRIFSKIRRPPWYPMVGK